MSDFFIQFNGGTISNPLIETANSLASTPAGSFTGTWFSGGTGTTTTPHFLIQPSGATPSSTWSTGGTASGINAATGFAGNFVDYKVAGVSFFTVASTGSVTIGSLSTYNFPEILLQNQFGSVGIGAGSGNSLAIQGPISFSTSLTFTNSGVMLSSSLALNQIEQRNGTNAQVFNVYNSFANPNNEWFGIDWQSVVNVCIVGPKASGTGTLRGMCLGALASNPIGFFGATPIVQPNSFGQTGGFTQITGSIVMVASTFTGGIGTTAYTIGDAINALKNLGLMAM